MPLYEYECEACGKRFEKIQKYSDPNPDVCQHCGKGPVRKLLSSPAIQFKGTGFYITDYKKSGGGGDSNKSSGSSSESSSSESKSSESKSSESKSTESKSTESKSSDSGSAPAAKKD
jgi:putative FmdB family regulatory protein